MRPIGIARARKKKTTPPAATVTRRVDLQPGDLFTLCNYWAYRYDPRAPNLRASGAFHFVASQHICVSVESIAERYDGVPPPGRDDRKPNSDELAYCRIVSFSVKHAQLYIFNAYLTEAYIELLARPFTSFRSAPP